jgi:hypothetical protein
LDLDISWVHPHVVDYWDWRSPGTLTASASRRDRQANGADKRMTAEYQPLADACKAKALKGQKDYYHVFFIATEVEAREAGLCSTVMRRYQEIASRDSLPIWLEATTEHSMKLYEKLGWEVADEIVLGKGKANPDGTLSMKGPGVKIWGMIWRPKRVA